jgi:glycosyltransferase involved in cell wall biosynthesis
MLKVAIIIERAEIGLGGAERSVSELTAELRDQGAEATILAAKGAKTENTQVLCNLARGKRTSLKVFENALEEHLRQNHYDIIHSTLPLSIADIYQPRGGSYKEAMLRNIASYPFTLQRCMKQWTHCLNLRRTESINAERRLCSKENKTIVAALSNTVRQQFQKHYQLPDNRIAVIPNAINIQLQPDEKTATELKESIYRSILIPKEKRPVLFLFAATNPRLKGLRPLLRAFREMRGNADAYPVLVTAGAKKLGSHRGLIKQFGLGNHVVSLGKLNGIRNALSICDAAVLPSYYDPCSRFILEAIAAEKPVITTRYNGASERYEHLRHGFVLNEPGDIEDLTNALTYFCNSEKLELAHDAIVADNLKDEVSIKRHVEKLIELYKKILNQRSHK